MNIQKRNVVLLALVAVVLTRCVPHKTGATEVGIKFNKFTRSIERADAGATYFFLPFVNDWKTYDTSTQSLIMSSNSQGGDRQKKDDLRFKTRDGNDIEADITVRWRIDPVKAEYVWKHVAPSTDDVKEKLVRPMARSYVRDVLNRLDSEEFYNPDLRFKSAAIAGNQLAAHLQTYGVLAEQVIIGNFSFKKDYQDLINARKEAEKQAEKLEAEILATLESNKSNLQSKIAELTQQLTISKGQLEQAQRAADAYLVQRQQGAQATTAERSAVAQGIRKERSALNGSAGDAYVTLQLIDALQKKEIRQIPNLPSGGNVILDGNRLLEQLGVVQYQQRRTENNERKD
ncbi:MAG TPA: SPFH domain-containing protein [Thermoanaerobaculia bacterium]|nr:SPFH domain-containing protein [Thermoanaerobaculia bacterium]